jgi:hypothetical protein
MNGILIDPLAASHPASHTARNNTQYAGTLTGPAMPGMAPA